MSDSNLLVILGPTASGKTHLAVQLARHLSGEIISADSRQVYRGLDIGSGKDLDEYEEIRYHLIDIVDPGYEFNVFDYQNCFFTAFNDLTKRNKLPILAGGSALYVDSVLDSYQLLAVPENPELRIQLSKRNHQQLVEHLLKLKPQQHNTTDLIDTKRLIRAIEIAEAEQAANTEKKLLPELRPFIIGINWQREIIRERITKRLKYRLENGMIEEVQNLHQGGVSWETLNYYGLEYRFVARYLQHLISHDEMFQKLNTAIHQFAKKQSTWLRRLQRNGHIIHWVEGTEDVVKQSTEIIKNNQICFSTHHKDN